VNYPTPGGLTIEETSIVIRRLLGTGKTRVLEVVAYNPTKDRGSTSANRIIELMKTVLD
jgi:arginase family enzyme